MLPDTSTQIITYIKNSLVPVYNIESIQLSPSTTKILSLLFNRIAYANEEWKLNNESIQLNKINKQNDIDTSYYPAEIQESLQNNIHHYYNSTFTINNRNIIIYIVTPQICNNQKLKIFHQQYQNHYKDYHQRTLPLQEYHQLFLVMDSPLQKAPEIYRSLS